jgi:O-antigen ligase
MLYDLIKTIYIKINIYRLITLVTIGICVYGMYEYFIKGESTVTSTLSPDHAHIGAFLSFTFFILLGYMFYTRSFSEKIVIFIALPISIYVLFLSNSRTGIIAILLGIGISLLTTKRYIAVIASIAILCIGIIGTTKFHFFDLLQKYQLGSAKFYNLESDISLLGRYYIWYVTYIFFTQHPIFLLTGIGLGASREVIGPYTQIGGVNVSGAHNQYIYYLTEFGIFGFIYFMYILYKLLSSSYKKYKNKLHRERWLYWGYFYGVITLLFNGITQDTVSVQLHFNNFFGYFLIVTAVTFKIIDTGRDENK